MRFPAKKISTFSYPKSPCRLLSTTRKVCTDGLNADIIIKFSPMDNLPNYFSYGACSHTLRACKELRYHVRNMKTNQQKKTIIVMLCSKGYSPQIFLASWKGDLLRSWGWYGSLRRDCTYFGPLWLWHCGGLSGLALHFSEGGCWSLVELLQIEVSRSCWRAQKGRLCDW